MTKLEKLNDELSKCVSNIKKLKETETVLLDKIALEEQKEIQKLMKQNHMSINELILLLEKNKN